MSDFVHGDQADVRPSHEVKHPHDVATSPENNLEAGSPPADLEKGAVLETPDSSSEEVIIARELQQRMGFLRTLRDGEEWLDRKMGIETQGIDRIHEEDKRPPSIINVFFLWWSLNCHVGALPLGVLGPEFGLSLNQSVAAIVVGILLGSLCTAFCGTLGPKVKHPCPNSLKAIPTDHLQAWSPCDCYFSILFRLLRRKALLCPQRYNWWWFRCRERRRRRSNSRCRLRLYHVSCGWLRDYSCSQLRDFHLRICNHPHLREVLLDRDLHHPMRSHR